MSKRKFKSFVVPSIYAITIFVFGTSLYLIQRVVNNNKFESNEPMEFVDKEIVTDNEYVPVVEVVPTILRPYVNEQVKINKNFYDYLGESTTQEDSIIYYEDTYMQNSGVDYTYTEIFDIISILDGTVIEVSDNEILGKTIKVRHTNDLISTYQCLSETLVNVDDVVARGQVIGRSGTSKLYTTDNNLHFELYYQGQNVNPETYYNKSQDEL